MHDRPMTFDEFRRAHHDDLRRRRERLRDDAIALEILREGGTRGGWIPWQEAHVHAKPR